MANQFTISTIFSAIDKMSGPISKMTASIDKMAKTASKGFSHVSNGLSKIGNIARGAGTVIAGAGVGMLALAKSAGQYGDDLNDMASILGMATQSLEEYRFAGSLVGIEASAMDAALQKLTVNLGKGGEATEEALAKIGVSSEMLKKAGPDKVLEVIADGFKNLKSPQDRAAVASALFGKSSVKLVNVLSKGSGAISDLRKEANDLGAVMSDDAVRMAGEMDDSFTRMMAGAGGLKNKLGAVVFPQIIGLVKGATEFLTTNGDKIGEAFKFIGDTVGSVFKYVGNLVTKLKPNLAFVPKVIENVAKFFEKMRPVIEQVGQTIMRIFGPAVEFISSKLSSLTPLFQGVANVFDFLGSVFNELLPVIETLWPIVDLLVWGFEKLTEVLRLIPDLIKTITDPFGLQKTDKTKIDVMSVGRMAGKDAGIQENIKKNFTNVFGGTDLDKINREWAAANKATPGLTPEQFLKGGQVPVSSQTSQIQSTINKNSTSTVDLNFNNPPAGTTIKQTGQAPGVNLNMGMAGGRP